MKTGNATILEFAGIAVAVILALLCGFAVILVTSDEPLNALASLLLGPVSNLFNIGTVLNKAVPLIFTGLALAVVFQSGVFSMGAEGQLYAGGFLGALAGVYIHGLTPWLHLPLVLICAMVGGALFAAIAGLLKTYANANEIVTTLMLNFVAILTTSYFVNNMFKDPNSGGFARMPYVNPEILLGKLFPGFPAHAGIVLALLAVVVVYLMLYKTNVGYELRLVGKSSRFAHYGGIATNRVVLTSIMISGAFAGLAGIVEILGVHGTYKDNFSAGLGFDGIIIALLARNHPIGVLIAALFYAYIQVGAQTMQVGSDMPREVAVIMQVMLVLLVSSQAIFVYLKQKYGQKAVK
ncbi:ABC transporter permease [Paenibacillus alkaliterrae]|uniref:ABC transporter permease n=1 Tax=Paenibacillus alkaliterrae TaxID=320909 RepID=UPI001F28613E|nr:ABC transporter permease [Paenibacillus alkaliterrae]MCF2941016.1 ABC transporter permease [Paenibacillus alkaliterrae]